MTPAHETNAKMRRFLPLDCRGPQGDPLVLGPGWAKGYGAVSLAASPMRRGAPAHQRKDRRFDLTVKGCRELLVLGLKIRKGGCFLFLLAANKRRVHLGPPGVFISEAAQRQALLMGPQGGVAHYIVYCVHAYHIGAPLGAP